MSTAGSAWTNKKSLPSRITEASRSCLPLDHSTDCQVILSRTPPITLPQRQYTDSPETSPILFRKLMLECQAILAEIPEVKYKRFAVCESGLAFLVPENVRTDDRTYEIRGRTSLIIIRPSERDSRICYSVARSVFNLWYVGPDRNPSVSRAEFKLDLYTLRMMSGVSSFLWGLGADRGEGSESDGS
jgi:hypothetical protein